MSTKLIYKADVDINFDKKQPAAKKIAGQHIDYILCPRRNHHGKNLNC